MERNGSDLDLPGFRFHPTEEELLDFYLRRAVRGKRLNFDIIGTLNLYRHDPWELPGLAKMGEREWYFFVPRDRKQANGGRPNRTTERGFWKATGSDRPIRSAADPRRLIGLKKTLVYYQGRAPRGSKTDWVMNEYRLPDDSPSSTSAALQKEDVVLCKIYRKATSMKELEQRAAMEEGARAATSVSVSAVDTVSTSGGGDWESLQPTWAAMGGGEEWKVEMKEEEVVVKEAEASTSTSVSGGRSVSLGLPALEVPKRSSLEWMQDPFLTQLRSPWMDPWSPYANLLNF